MNVYVERDHARRLTELSMMKCVSKSSIVAAALSALFGGDSPERREASVTRRLDKLTRQFDALDRDQTILIETLALFIRHQLGVAASIAQEHQPLIRAQAQARFSQFVAQLVAHLQRGGSLVRKVAEEMAPAEAGGQEPTSTQPKGPLP